MQAARLHHDHGDVGGKHDQVAMGDVDQAHDAEDQRKPGGKQRVKPADQNSLNDGVDPVHASGPEIGG